MEKKIPGSLTAYRVSFNSGVLFSVLIVEVPEVFHIGCQGLVELVHGIPVTLQGPPEYGELLVGALHANGSADGLPGQIHLHGPHGRRRTQPRYASGFHRYRHRSRPMAVSMET